MTLRRLVRAGLGALGGAIYASTSPSDVHCYRSKEREDVITFAPRSSDALSSNYRPYPLGEVIPITHDVALFRFLMHRPEDEFRLRPCATLQACVKNGVQAADIVQRFYTPVTPNGARGYFDIIVKRKAGGAMTKHLFGMHVGDKMLFRVVPFKIRYQPNRWKHVGMVAGGTGLTPMLQVIRHALTEPLEPGVVDRTQLHLLYCNRTEKHVLLKGLIDELAKNYPDRFRVTYTVDALTHAHAKWEGSVGLVTPELARAALPSPEDGSHVVLVCGPDGLLHHVAGTSANALSTMSGGNNIQPLAVDLANMGTLGGVLAEVGYEKDNVYCF